MALEKVTNFPGGLSDRIAPDPMGLSKMALLDPTRFIRYFTDFLEMAGIPTPVADNQEWDVSITGATPTAVLTDGLGGQMLLTNTAGVADRIFLRKIPEAFLWSLTKRLYFEIRFKVSDATQSDILAGLMITDATPLDVTDGIFIQKDDGDALLDFHVEKNNVASDVTAFGTLVSNVFTVLTFFYDPDTRLFYVYQDDVLKGTAPTTNAVDDEELSVTFGIQNGEAVAKNMTIDYILALLER